MASSQPAAAPLFIDPDNVPVNIVDQVTFHGIMGGHLDLTCCSVRKTPDTQGNVVAVAVAVARLRFDVVLAKAMRDALDRQIAAATAVSEERDLSAASIIPTISSRTQ